MEIISNKLNEPKPFRLRTCKVPQVTIYFWVIKVFCTTVGETLSDEFNTGLNLGLGVTAAIFFPILVAILVLQFKLDHYIPTVYWLSVVLMSICGTIATDGLHDNLGVELYYEDIMFFFLMVFSFSGWYYYERSLDVHSINTIKREGWYWSVVIFTFAMGTSIGDGISESAGLGYPATMGLFIGIITFLGIIWYFKVLPSVTSFWLCYIMTRPLGASIGDLVSSYIGTESTSLIFLAVIVVCVIFLHYSKVDVIVLVDNENDDTKPIKNIDVEENLVASI